ncbi:MAG: SMC family ATPase [Chloroflexota bacterium]
MIPIKLTLSGFLSYQEPQEIDFSGFNLACISGGNGAGKSSLLDGITWALFGQARKRDDAIINLSGDTAEVSFTFMYEGNCYRVTRVKPRGKTTVLEFHIQAPDDTWKVLTERSMRATEARIEEILRLDYETFVNASFFLQGKADQFTQQRPADRKRILSSILGLEIWEAYRKTTAEQRKLSENQIAALDGRLQEINTELAEKDQRLERLKALEDQLKTISETVSTQSKLLGELRQQASLLNERQQLVDTLSTQLERAQQANTAQQDRLAERQAEKSAFDELMAQAKKIEQRHKKWEQAKINLAEWDQTSEQFNQFEKERHKPLTEIETARTRLETERDGLLQKKAELDEQLAEEKILNAQHGELQIELKKLNASMEERAELEKARQLVFEQQAEAKAENPLLKAEMEELVGRIEQLDSTEGADCPLCGQPLSPEERERLIAELKAEGKEKGDKYRANVDMLKEVTSQVEALDKQLGGFKDLDNSLREQTRLLDQLSDQLTNLEKRSKQWGKSEAPKLKKIITTLEKRDFAKQFRKTLAKIDAELKEIGYDATSHDAAREQEVELSSAVGELRKLENARATLAPLEREIKELEKQITKDQKNLAEQDEAHTKAVAVLAAAQAEAPDTLAAERKMLELQEQENKVRMELGMAQQNVSVLDTLSQRKQEIEAEREEFAKQIGDYRQLERAFGKDGVPAMLIEQALPQIESKANEVLERLSGGSMSIRFITQQAYKDSKREDLRETLEIQISDNAGIRDYEMYSGGEAFRINFAIRLALSEVLAQRAGARLQTLVIDEGFGSQDEIGRQRLVEAINLVKTDFEKILVITHIEALKDAFPNRLEIRKTDHGSVVEVI